MSIKLIFLALFFFSVSSLAKSDFSPQLLAVIQKYGSSKLVTMKVHKKIKSELMEKETDYLGSVSLSGEKFRLDTETPDKAEILFDGNILWNVQFPSKDAGGAVQVLKSKVTKKNRSQILLSALTNRKSLKKNFKVIKEGQLDGQSVVTIQPKTSDLAVKSIDVQFDPNKKLLTKISYKDDIGNSTTMEFSEAKFLNKAPPNLFKIQVPQDAQTTEL